MFYLTIAAGLEPAGSAADNVIIFNCANIPSDVSKRGHLGDGGVETKVGTSMHIHVSIQVQFILLTKPCIGTEIHESR